MCNALFLKNKEMKIMKHAKLSNSLDWLHSVCRVGCVSPEDKPTGLIMWMSILKYFENNQKQSFGTLDI